MIKNIIILVLVVVLLYTNRSTITGFFKKTNKKKKLTKKKIVVDMKSYEKDKRVVDEYITSSIQNDITDKKMNSMCLQSVLDGKRARSVIMVSIYKHLNKNLPDFVLDGASCIELIHCASLILDDIMDDDVERRDKPCIHTKYGVTMAQLVAMALVGLSFKKLCGSLKKLLDDPEKGDITNRSVSLIIFNTLAEKMQSLVIGQYFDIDLPKILQDVEKSNDDNKRLDGIKTNIEKMIMMKTGSLFELSFIWPYILTNSQKSDDQMLDDIEKMGKIANLFGMIFQISDDFEDVEQDMQKEQSINNFVICVGKKEAKEYYDTIVEQFVNLTKKNKILTPEIVEILNYLGKRVDAYYY